MTKKRTDWSFIPDARLRELLELDDVIVERWILNVHLDDEKYARYKELSADPILYEQMMLTQQYYKISVNRF